MCATFFALALSGAAQAAPPEDAPKIAAEQRGQSTLLIQSSPLAGSQFHALPDVVSQIRVGDTLTLQRDPTNPHDSNAIKVLWQGHMLGFVPRRENKAVARAMDRGQPLVARVVALRPEESPWRRLRFEISVILSD
ncbi:MAG: HIRAN domain-containing protein [Polynucleobacter victoriensis]